MSILDVRDALVEELEATLLEEDTHWRVHGYMPRKNEAWHAPAVTIDRPALLTGEGTMGGATPMTCRLLAITSENDTSEHEEALYAWLDWTKTGLLRRISAIENDLWQGGIQVLGAEINDDLRLGPTSYRAAIVTLRLDPYTNGVPS